MVLKIIDSAVEDMRPFHVTILFIWTDTYTCDYLNDFLNFYIMFPFVVQHKIESVIATSLINNQ